MKTIRIQDYDPLWPDHFRQLQARIWPSVQDTALAIEHVGSTSVPGLAAKPVIDIDLVIRRREDLPIIVERLNALGYRHRGNLGVEDRDAFRAPADASIVHHLYVCPAESLALRNHLVLRDHLRSDPSARIAYEQLKRDLGRLHATDAERYAAGKTEFVLAILRGYGFGFEELAKISDANRGRA